MTFIMLKQGYSTKGNKSGHPPKYYNEDDRIATRKVRQREHINNKRRKLRVEKAREERERAGVDIGRGIKRGCFQYDA